MVRVTGILHGWPPVHRLSLQWVSSNTSVRPSAGAHVRLTVAGRPGRSLGGTSNVTNEAIGRCPIGASEFA